MRPRIHSWLAVLACFIFFAAGQIFIPLLGIEADEAIFASPLLNPRSWHFAIQIGHSRFPLMIMSYIGTLKTLLYALLFRVFAPGVWSMREPMLVAGAASLWIFYLLLRRAAGARAAVVGTALLATDSLYLLTTCFDWGPVALQHLLLLGGVLLMVRFAQEPKRPGAHRALAGGFFLLGLAMWDKALAVWMISGMAVAAAVVYWRPIAVLATRRRAAIAALGFLLGALPLAIFNAETSGSTFRGNMKRDTAEAFFAKAGMLGRTVNGQGLFGYLTEEDWKTPRPHAPQSALERASNGLAEAAGQPRHNLMLYAAVLALALTPFCGRAGRRMMAFCLIALAIAWVQMAITENTGGTVHHTILLWPLPVFVIAVAFADGSRRLGRAGAPVLAAVAVVLAASNVLLMNEYRVMMARNGASVAWSDAIFPLAERLKAAPGDGIYCVDWGIEDPLRLIGRGKLPLNDVAFGTPGAGTFGPEHIYVGHTTAMEAFKGNAARLDGIAAAAGYRREGMIQIPDSFGRPTFEVYRFVR